MQASISSRPCNKYTSYYSLLCTYSSPRQYGRSSRIYNWVFNRNVSFSHHKPEDRTENKLDSYFPHVFSTACHSHLIILCTNQLYFGYTDYTFCILCSSI